MSASTSDKSPGDGGEGKKAIHSEINRQSAAKRREWKKIHISELEQRVPTLSGDNTVFQLDQEDCLRKIMNREREVFSLNKKVLFRDIMIEQLTRKLEKASLV